MRAKEKQVDLKEMRRKKESAASRVLLKGRY